MTKRDHQTVFIVDDDAAVRDSIEELLDSVGLTFRSFDSAPAFLDFYPLQQPGCLVLDVRMLEMSGLALQQKLNEMGSTLPVIILTGHGDVPMAVQAMRAGAVDFLQKPYRDQALLDSIVSALNLDDQIRGSRAAGDEFEYALATLTDRERQVLEKLLDGSTSKEIARDLQISPRTADAHRRNLLQKLKLASVKELMRTMVTRGRGI